MVQPFLPHGRFLHVPPSEPTSSWDTEFGTPWWLDMDLVIGTLSKRTRKVRIVNALTQQNDVLLVCNEETVAEMRDRYIEYNKHATSYTWKRLDDDGKFVKLTMSRTLEENGVVDDSVDFEALGIDEDYYYTTIHVYFNDDLTYA